MNAIDQNGRKVKKQVRQESDGKWSAVVWSGLGTKANPACSIRRQYGYATRADAMRADISKQP